MALIKRAKIPSLAIQATLTLGVLALVLIIEKALSYKSTDWQYETKAAELCITKPPLVKIQNNYAWSDWGTWAKSGQRVPFAIQIFNADTEGCQAAVFTVRPELPEGFIQQPSSFTVRIQPGGKSQVQTVYITSPAGTINGDYAINQIARRSNSVTGTGQETSWYKVYSADTTAPVIAAVSPADGQTINGNAALTTNARDDHMVRKLEIYIDGKLAAADINDGISYTSSLTYDWDTRLLSGAHTVTYKAVDDFGNATSRTVRYTVKQ